MHICLRKLSYPLAKGCSEAGGILLSLPVETLTLKKKEKKPNKQQQQKKTPQVALGRKNASGCWLANHLKEEEGWAPVTILNHSLRPVALHS